MLRYAKTRPAPPIKERYIAYKEPYITPKEPYLRFCRAQGSRGSGWGRCRVRDLAAPSSPFLAVTYRYINLS